MPGVRTAVLVAALFALACAGAYNVPNHRLTSWDPGRWNAPVLTGDTGRSNDVFLMLAFSGGGTRSAAFSYGVLQELAEMQVRVGGRDRRVIDEIDMISSVSGGSFTAAYYGLHGDGIFEDFEDAFLRRNVQGDLLRTLFKPKNWGYLFSLRGDRSEIARSYYDEKVFDYATLGDLHRPGAPMVVINSTDLATGERFPFMPWQFDLICSDADTFPVSRAVAASAAVPVVFSPVRLRNYAGSCDFEPPAWLRDLADESSADRRQRGLATDVLSYLDSDARPWIHLVDGGISDNLGILAVYTWFALRGGIETAMKSISHGSAHSVILLLVDAAPASKHDWQKSSDVPSATSVTGAVTDSSMKRTAIASRELVDADFREWAGDLAVSDHPSRFHFVELDFGQATDPAEAAYLGEIETSLALDDEKVDRLIAAGREIVSDSEPFRAALRDASR